MKAKAVGQRNARYSSASNDSDSRDWIFLVLVANIVGCAQIRRGREKRFHYSTLPQRRGFSEQECNGCQKMRQACRTKSGLVPSPPGNGGRSCDCAFGICGPPRKRRCLHSSPFGIPASENNGPRPLRNALNSLDLSRLIPASSSNIWPTACRQAWSRTICRRRLPILIMCFSPGGY